MPNGDHVLATFRVAGERHGVSIDLRGGHLLRMTDAGLVAEGWGFVEDQDALDRFSSS